MGKEIRNYCLADVFWFAEVNVGGSGEYDDDRQLGPGCGSQI